MSGEWPYVLGGAAVVALVVWLRGREGAPDVPAAPPPAGAPPRGQITGAAPVTVVAGRTYFGVLQANGDVSLAANPERIESALRDRGFSDVVVFEHDKRPDTWPGVPIAGSDYFIRATYKGAPRAFPRIVDRTFGSAKLLDIWEV